ncbi:Lysophosphatidylcholine acyltransferase [Cyanidiococcus yangmingshanensis]|uniref:Lysophosphatidylcholine acyltransferase n=1 Tax=Cyanidiococcus yangmingshanensis TaxID=2690220 RepID=A0A7J7ICT2_9RHOD|nr:Lysophosphatidylcholine acyltransferase [Cyanidiococcus yangmingshanensis]
MGLVTISISGLDERHFSMGSAEPLSRWRRYILTVVRWLARLELFIMGFYWIEEYTIKARDDSKHNVSAGPVKPDSHSHEAARKRETAPIIVSNHIAIFESLYFYARFAPSFLAKSDVRKLFIFGSVTAASSSIFVERSEESSRQQVSKEIERRIRDYPPGSWPPFMIYPEQTTTNGSAIIYFKLGAFSAGLPVQPVAIRYPFCAFHPGMVADVGLLKSFIYTCLQPYSRMQVYYLPIEYPSGYEREQPVLFAERVRQAIAKILQVPLTLHDITDMHFQKAAYDLRKVVIGREMSLELRRFAGLIEMVPTRARDCELMARAFIEEFHRGTGHKPDALCHPDEIGRALFGSNCPDHAMEDSGTTVSTLGWHQWLCNLFQAGCLTVDSRVDFRDYVVFRQFMRRWLRQFEVVAQVHHFCTEHLVPQLASSVPGTELVNWLDGQFGGPCWRDSPASMHEAFQRNERAACLVVAQLLC